MNLSMVKEVARREIVTRSRTRVFRGITGLLLAAAIIGPIVAAVWPEGGSDLRKVTIGLVDVDPATETRIALAAQSLDVTFRDLNGASPEQVDAALTNGDIDLAVEPGPTVVWDEEIDYELAGVVYAALQQLETEVRGRGLGFDQGQIAELLAPVQIEEQFADETSDSDAFATTVAYLGLLIVFLLPQVFGPLILMSVVEEKSTRVVEVLLSHIRPRTLLIGKVVGVSALALLQLTLMIGGLTAALALTNVIDVPASVWRYLPIVTISVIGGLAMYNTLYALLGSLISRQEDTSQVLLPVFVPIMAGYLVGSTAAFGNADSTLAKLLTYIPLTAPMLLPVRVARDAIAPWEVALSLGLLALAVWLLIRVAGRVYEFTLLQTGARVGWGELLQLSRGAVLD